jgi:hypothetical protein
VDSEIKSNPVAGGGRESEKNEDILDKDKFFFGCIFSSHPNLTMFQTDTVTGIDFVQEKFMGQGPQNTSQQ